MVLRELVMEWVEEYSACCQLVLAAAVDSASAGEDAVHSCQVDQWVVEAESVQEAQILVLVVEDHRIVPESHIQEAADHQSSFHNQEQLQAVRESHARHQAH